MINFGVNSTISLSNIDENVKEDQVIDYIFYHVGLTIFDVLISR